MPRTLVFDALGTPFDLESLELSLPAAKGHIDRARMAAPVRARNLAA